MSLGGGGGSCLRSSAGRRQDVLKPCFPRDGAMKWTGMERGGGRGGGGGGEWLSARANTLELWSVCLFVGCLLNVPATCQCISGTDLHRQFYVLPH